VIVPLTALLFLLLVVVVITHILYLSVPTGGTAQSSVSLPISLRGLPITGTYGYCLVFSVVVREVRMRKRLVLSFGLSVCRRM
jgi:hypothetical protein